MDKYVVDLDDEVVGSDSSWVVWNGGQRPVEYETVVAVKFRGGGEPVSGSIAGVWFWEHLGWDSDIVSYRVLY